MLSKHLHRGCYDLFGLLHNLWGERSIWEYLSRVWFQLEGLCNVEFIVACSWDTMLVLLMLSQFISMAFSLGLLVIFARSGVDLGQE